MEGKASGGQQGQALKPGNQIGRPTTVFDHCRETAGWGGFPSAQGFSFGNGTGKNLEALGASRKQVSKEGRGIIAAIYSFN